MHSTRDSLTVRYSSIDIFCRVIDNFGDAGVVYRFAKEFLLARPACRLRVFCDGLNLFSLLRPGIDADKTVQECGGILFVNFSRLDRTGWLELGPADVVVEAFGCDIPAAYRTGILFRPGAWINLEYLSAEPWVDGYHKRQSLTGTGGVKKYFFMPGFTAESGGVIIDSAVEHAKADLASHRLLHLNALLGQFGVHLDNTRQTLVCTLFTYTRGFDTFLADIRCACEEAFLLVCGEKSREGMLASLARTASRAVGENHYAAGSAHVLFMPFLPQNRFDELLCLADFNIVRGEDSLVRAILAEKPFIWNAYLQDEKYHKVKVAAFCDEFGKYFEDETVFRELRDLFMRFNDAGKEESRQATSERFGPFFRDLKKIERATREMSYFITRNCSLMEKFTDFLSGI